MVMILSLPLGNLFEYDRKKLPAYTFQSPPSKEKGPLFSITGRVCIVQISKSVECLEWNVFEGYENQFMFEKNKDNIPQKG